MKTKTLKLSGNMIAIPFTAPEIETDEPASPSPAAPCSSASHLPLVPPVGVTEAAKAPLFAVGDTVRVIHPENYPSDIRAGDTTEGTVTHILPDIRKRFVYVCSPIGSWFENQIERVTAAAPAPVSPSLPEFTERAGFPWHSTGTEIRRADNDAIASIHFATPSNRSLPSINEAEKLAKLICETLASHATLKANVERLTGALDDLLTAIHVDAASFPSSPGVVESARLSLAEVGKH
jgi:hypothetical protein